MICGYAMKMMLQIEDHTAFKEAEKKGEEFNKSRKQPKKYSFIAPLQKNIYYKTHRRGFFDEEAMSILPEETKQTVN